MRLAFVLVLVAVPAHAADPPPQARVELSPKGGAWVGQRVTLAVTLLTPDLFAGAPTFDVPPIPGVVILPPPGSPVIGSETVGDTSFTTQRHEFAVYAQRAGSVQIPAFAVRFESNAGFGKPTVQRQVTTTAVSFTAKSPPGAEGLGTVIAAHDLKVTDRWSPESGAAKVGDAFTRTTTVTAGDVPGMVFPAFRLDGIDGLAAYPKDPAVSDRTERGVLTGMRTETVTYVCERAGSVTVPDRTLTWFDLDANELRTVKLPGRTLTVAAAPEPELTATQLPPQPSRSRWWRIGAAVLVVVLVGGVLVWSAWRWGAHRYAEWRVSEAAAFAHLRRACRSNDPHAVFVALMRWLDRAGLVSLAELEHRAAAPELHHVLADLEARAYARPDGATLPPWSAQPLLARLADVRRDLRAATPRSETGALPPLNPSR